MHEHEGMQCPRASADISDKSLLHMLHMLCYVTLMYVCTSTICLKICLYGPFSTDPTNEININAFGLLYWIPKHLEELAPFILDSLL